MARPDLVPSFTTFAEQRLPDADTHRKSIAERGYSGGFPNGCVMGENYPFGIERQQSLHPRWRNR